MRKTNRARQSNKSGVNIIHTGEGDILLGNESTESSAIRVQDAYSAIVQNEFAPKELRGREDELADIDRFCCESGSYLWVQAPPYSGKTALAAWFVLHPPPGMHVLSYFIRSTMVSEANSDAFAAAMMDQLSAAASIPRIKLSPGYGGRGHYWDMLEKAANVIGERGQRLVVVVDGLDEDCSSGTGIACLLPPDPPPSVRVLVCSRPYADGYPPGITDDHALRTARVQYLTPSPHAQDSGKRARQELDAYLTEGNADTERLLGFITASGGGLTTQDLASLTSRRQHVVSRLLGSRSRILQVVDRRGRRSYALAHAEISAAAHDLLSDVVADCRAELHSWADHYKDAGWPQGTPDYLLDSYASMLAARGDWGRLAALAHDSLRHERMRQRTGGDMLALKEIADARQARTDPAIHELKPLALITIEHYRITTDNTEIPPGLPAVWATLGDIDRGEALAHSITNFYRRQSALYEAAVAIAAASPGRAEQIARAIEEPDSCEHALSSVVAATAAVHPDEAERIACSISDRRWQAHALTDVAAAMIDADPGRAARLTVKAAEIARSVPHQGVRAWELARVGVTANAFDPDLGARVLAEAIEVAESIADKIGPGPVHTWVLRTDAFNWVAGEIARVDVEQAERVACLGAGYKLHEALSKIAVEAAETRLDVAARLAGESFSLAAQHPYTGVPNPGALIEIIARLAATDLRMAEQISASIPDERSRESALSRLAMVVAAADRPNAERIARSITNPDRQAAALAILMAVSAGSHSSAYTSFAEAERIAQSITDIRERSYALGKLSEITANYDPSLAERVTQSITEEYPLRHAAVKLAQADPEAGKRVARRIINPWFKSLALTDVAKTIVNAHPELAAALCIEIEGIARSASADSGRPEIFSRVSTAIARVNPALAERIARLISDDWWRARALAEISAELSGEEPDHAARLRQEAESVAASLTDRKDKMSLLAGIGGSYYRLSRPALSSDWAARSTAFELATSRWPRGIGWLADLSAEAAVSATEKFAELFEVPDSSENV